MGRKRKWNSEAERLRAYRAKKKEEKESLYSEEFIEKLNGINDCKVKGQTTPKKVFGRESKEKPLRKKIVRQVRTTDIDVEKYYEMVEDFLTICKNRGAAKRILKSTAKTLVDGIVRDINKN